MKGVKSRILGVTIAMMIILATTATPIMAATPEVAPAKSCGEPISKEESDKIVKTILGSDKIKEISSKLKDKNLDWSQPVLTKSGDGYILAVYDKEESISKKKGVIVLYDGIEIKNVFLTESRKITDGAAISLRSVINDDATDLLFVKGEDGQVKIHMKDLKTGTVTTLELSCMQICTALTGIGCTITSAAACTIVCVGTAGFGCPILCGLVWYLLCDLAISGCGSVCSMV